MNRAIPKEETEGLYEHFSFKVAAGQTPLRVDKFLLNRIENVSRNKIQLAAKNNKIFVNKMPVKSNYKVKNNDKIQVLFSYPPHENLLVPEKMPLDIIFEDEALIIINKSPGVVVHPGHGNYSKTLLNGLLYYFKEKYAHLDIYPNLVHRIDKDTSGLLVIAKTEEVLNTLAAQFINKTSQRTYYALVWGNVKKEKDTIEAYIGRHPKDRLQMTVFIEGKQGKKAVTHYKVLERFTYVTLISCQLETGRTHQIRTHLKYIGHPIFNDGRYGGDLILKGTRFSKYKQFVENCFKLIPRQALHAKTLGFIHPLTQKRIQFDSALPEDMHLVITKWRNYAKHKYLVI